MNDCGVAVPFDLEQRPTHGYPLIHAGGCKKTHDGRELLGSKVVPEATDSVGTTSSRMGIWALYVRQGGQGDGVLSDDYGRNRPVSTLTAASRKRALSGSVRTAAPSASSASIRRARALASTTR